MHKRLKRFITFMLALTLICTNFGSDFASARAYAVTDEDELEVTVDSSEISDIFEDIPDVETSEESEENEEEIVVSSEGEVDYSSAEAAVVDATLVEEKSEGLENNIEESVKESSAEGEAVAAISGSTEEGNAASLASSDAAALASSEDAATLASSDAAALSSSEDAATLASSDAAALASSDAAALASSDAAALASSEEEEPIEFSPDPVVLNGVKITLYAMPGVLPNDAELQVSEIESNLEDKITEAIDEDTGADVEVVKTISYDIKIYSESEGDFVQPEDGTVRVTFEEIDEASDEEIALAVYHVEESGDEVENVDEVKKGEENSTETEIGFDAKHFSIYTIAFLKEEIEGKAAKFQIVPIDENGKEINISNYGETIVTIDSDVVSSAEDLALNLPGYEYISAYYEKDIDGAKRKADVTGIEVDTTDQKLFISYEYSGTSYTDQFDWVKKKKNEGSNIPKIKYIYKNSDDISADSELIYFFVLIDGNEPPLTSDGDSQGKYYPSYGSNGYKDGKRYYGESDINNKWVGRAKSLLLVDDEDKDGVKASYHKMNTENIYDLTGAKVEKYIIEKPTDKINDYFASEYPGYGFGDNDNDYNLTEEDIVWYVYKNQIDAFHIDGYINSAVRYNTNFGATPDTSTDTVRFLTNYNIKDYGDVFSTSRDGYTFVGWSTDPYDYESDGIIDNNTYYYGNYSHAVAVNEVITVGKKVTLYAQWKKDGVLDTNIEVWAKDDEWFYDGTEHTNNEILKQTSDDPNYEVTAIVTNGKVKNVSDTSALNNKITKVTIKDKTSNKEYTFTVNGNSEVVTINGEKTKVTVHNSTLTIKPRTVTLTSKSLSKKFDGTYLTADERYAAGEKYARDITPTAFNKEKGEGFVANEGIVESATEFTGKLLAIKKVEKANTFNYTLQEKTLAENYKIEREYGNLEITPPDEKIKLKIKLKANADGTGRDTYVIYDGTTQQAIMEVHVTVEGEVDTESLLKRIIEALKNGASSLLNAGTLVAYAADKPGDPIKVDAQTINIAGLEITVDNLYVHGGAGTDVGHYPIILDYSGMTIVTTINGEEIDLSKVVELEIDSIKGETEKYNVNPEIKTDEDIIGWLHVSEREVTMLSDTASKQYDGTPLTAKHVTETEYVEDKTSNKGFVPGEGADYDITGSLVGSATETQSVRNDYTYTLKSNTKASNYIITQEYGTLTVTPLGGGDNPPPPGPNPGPDPDPDPSPDPDPDPDPPTTTTVVPPSPVAAVLGARRETVSDGAAVLGARRAGTEDTTNDNLRIFVVVIAAGAAISLLFFGKKKEKDKL
ncbi:MAG: hypothetical protein J6O61_00800 [Butyrivibrio sp.]|uniref:hypothetical protein n=1 Tax=Butyrivibrio sp. TaxID=28121 RepID=UPI001B16668D|nr:hypothetical protein [Butyrivibrio sp.]MBO6239400.1 hypothetical protein [Butyrivibrio sp.]